MVFYVLFMILCTVWSIVGQPQNTKTHSVKIDTGWSIEGDRWVWGYADTLTPNAISSPIRPQILTVSDKMSTSDNQNNAAVTTTQQLSPDINIKGIDSKLLKELIEKNATLARMLIDACTYNPSIPDFNVPGRRISDVKCQEYIWNIKYTTEKISKRSGCGYLKYQLTGNLEYIPTTVGGRTTAPGEFPHMGAIGWTGSNGEWQFKCGSSLISPKYVLTAAHCSRTPESDTTVADPVPKIIRLSHKNIVRGVPSKTVGEFDINIINIINHPEYIPPRKYYDIALMEIEREVGFSQLVQPSCLWGHSDINKLGYTATLTGWGVLAQGSVDISPELQAAVLDIIDSDKCAQYLRAWCNRNWCGVRDNQLCAGKLAGGVDACQGDSGSPLQVKIPLDIDTPYNMYNIIGITSFGVGCAQPNLPGVYTRVSSFIDWIEGIVWPQ